jgi:hypothetical protein
MKTKKKQKANLLLGSKTFIEMHIFFTSKIFFSFIQNNTKVNHWKWTKKIKNDEMNPMDKKKPKVILTTQGFLLSF